MTITFPFYLRPSTPFIPVHSVAGTMVHSLISKPLEMIRITRNYVQMAFLWPSRIRLFSIQYLTSSDISRFTFYPNRFEK